MNIKTALAHSSNFEVLSDLAAKANYNSTSRTPLEAVYMAASVAIINETEEEINSWDLTDDDSCGINRYQAEETRNISWDAFIGNHQGDDVTRGNLEAVAAAEEWYDNDWTEIL